jgi:hypothetical protein
MTAHIVGQNRNDLGECVADLLAERCVGALRDPARSEHERLSSLLLEAKLPAGRELGREFFQIAPRGRFQRFKGLARIPFAPGGGKGSGARLE